MAFTDSIKWNGKSIRDLFTEITRVKGRGKPPVEVKSVAIPGRHGRIAFNQTYKPRIIEIEGTIEGVSHATLMNNIENLKSLFAMEDETVSPGEESITDRFKYGRLDFGDEPDRHYDAVFDSVFELQDISHQWMSNEMKLIRARFRCDEPFAISNVLTEATMTGNADGFKVFSTGNVQSKPFIELSGAVTNPMLIEGDKVGVAHFDYNDNLSDVTLSTISGNFTPAFGYRNRKSLTSQQSKAIQIVNRDNLYFDRGSVVDNQNYVNFNPYQGTVILWVKPYFDGDDEENHAMFEEVGDSNNSIIIRKHNENNLAIDVKSAGVSKRVSIAVNSSNFGAGNWYFIAVRWDLNNDFDGTNVLGIRLDTVDNESSNTLSTPAAVDATLQIGQDKSLDSSVVFDGLIHWQVFERALTDSEVSDLYNSGAGVEPFVTPDTKLLSVGELSGGDPVSIQYPQDIGAANGENGNRFADGNMEDNDVAQWTNNNLSTMEKVTDDVKYDLRALHLVAGGSPPRQAYQDITVTSGDAYLIDFWAHGNSGNTLVVHDLTNATDIISIATNAGSYINFSAIFDVPATCVTLRIYLRIATNTFEFFADQLRLHKSEVTNGRFDADTDWGKGGAGLTVADGVAKFVYGSESLRLSQTLSDVNADSWYTLFYEVTVQSGAPNFILENGNIVDSSLTLDDSVGKHTVTFKSAQSGSFQNLQFRTTGGTLHLDNVSIIELDTVTANASSKTTTEIDSYSQEKFGYGLRLDGGDTLSWSMTGNKNEGSVVCWFKPKFSATWADETDDPVIYELYYDTNNYLRLSYDWTNDKFIFTKRAAGVDYDAEAGNQTFEDGELLSVIGTYGSNGVRIYINGNLGGVVNSNAAPLTGNPGTLYLSNDTQTQFPDAIIDEIYLLSRALSATEALKYLNQSKQIKNNNTKLSLTKTLSGGDKLLIDSEKETIEFVDSSADSFTNAIASMDAGSFFPNMDSNESVLFNKVANAGIKLNYYKKWL